MWAQWVISHTFKTCSPDWKGQMWSGGFNTGHGSATGVAEELPRSVASCTILPFPTPLQCRCICYIKSVERRILLQAKPSTCPIGIPVGGAPVTHMFTPLDKSSGSWFVLGTNEIALHPHLPAQEPVVTFHQEQLVAFSRLLKSIQPEICLKHFVIGFDLLSTRKTLSTAPCRAQVTSVNHIGIILVNFY